MRSFRHTRSCKDPRKDCESLLDLTETPLYSIMKSARACL